MKVLIMNGSHRQGNTDIFLKILITKFKDKNIAVKELILRNIEMKMPDGCEVCSESGICPNIFDEFSQKIEPSIRNYDLYIIATPTWSDNVTPLTKIFWDRIVSWCHESKQYLKGKKLVVITHGMAGKDSWKHVINWGKSICKWEGCNFIGSFTFKSGSRIGDINFSKKNLNRFITNILG